MFLKLLPESISKYFRMSRRQREHELKFTLWRMPVIYILITFLLAAVTLALDLVLGISEGKRFAVNFETTRLLVSSLIGGILTLSAFSLNSLLVVLTTFSGQFSPRMLQDFIADRQTQHIMGIFNGSFVYVLLIFLFISSYSKHYFIAVPVVTCILAFITALTFIFFINHATSWMQVHNITFNMKNISKEIIRYSLKKDLEEFRTMEPGDLLENYRSNATIVRAQTPGYVQLINYREMIEQARQDNIIIKVNARVGNFVLSYNPLFTYWGPGAENINEEKYQNMIIIGHKETEIQDIKSGMKKLAEVSVKAIGNDDPRTTINAIHQMGELLLTIDQYITFTPYLADNDRQVRVIIGKDTFDFYLYQGFGTIRHYAKNDFPITFEIISSLSMLALSIDPSKYAGLWNFAYETVQNVGKDIIYDSERHMLLHKLYKLASTTGNELAYYQVEKQLTGSK
ncbi:DUF2254 domain-containing protein [Sediminibacillus albus]|uniref:Uncharacterized membrane protein n=1 Tax=Sediminibacillus albus TaxID=407036 RepID=A0A1G8XDQ6_9BACI|nr:DUF2254 domain-containing protein [Sediminibacillus albus]SDJ87900.1 Uncharacterized membrane protein [Sediminibacillus albus]